MADWSILKTSSKDFLSSLSSYSNHSNHDPTMTQLHMMSSYFEQTFPSHSIYDENTFCTRDNVEECIRHLSQELTGLGLQPLSHDNVTCKTTLVNRLEEILRLYQRSGRLKEELENRVHRITCDATENQSVIRRLKADKERSEKEVAQEKERHRQTHSKLKGLSSKLKTEKDEARRLQSVIKDRDAQYKHELKKKQREINKLMEKLHQLLMDKNPDRRVGMDMEGLMRRGGDNKRSTWKNTKTSSKQEEMYQLLITNYEEKHQELRVENSDLRDCLLDMQKQLSLLVDMSDSNMSNVQNGDLSSSSSDEEDSTTSLAYHDLNDDYFQMPYELMRENLHKNFKDTCKRLRNTIRKCPNKTNTLNGAKSSPQKSSANKWPVHRVEGNRENEKQQEDIDKLRRQVDKYKDIVKQQEELIQQSLSSQSISVENTFLHESQILQEKESLSEQRRTFYQEKANFEEERRKVAESARQMQMERKRLEEEKASMMRSQFSNVSPFSSSSRPPQAPSSKEKSRLLPSTPVFSPAPGKSSIASQSAQLLKIISQSKKKSPVKEQNGSSKSLAKCGSMESLSSSCPSAQSAPGELSQLSSRSSKRSSYENSEQSSVSTQGLILDNIEHIERSLFSKQRRRSSLSSLDGH